jgi:hypothetical protein
MNLSFLPGRIFGWLRQTRYPWLLILVLLCLALRENYPFSNFPMYSSFGERSYFLYLATAQGEPIRTRVFGLSTSTLKKIFDRQRREQLKRFAAFGSDRTALADKAAAESLLHYLDGIEKRYPSATQPLAGVQVRHVLVHQQSDQLLLETRMLAQHP